jgi:hypothetical protein
MRLRRSSSRTPCRAPAGTTHGLLPPARPPRSKRSAAKDGGDNIVLASASIIGDLLEAGEQDRLSITLCPQAARRWSLAVR